MNTDIVKMSGQSVPFDAERLRLSLQRSGAAPERADAIVDAVAKSLYPGMSTKKIYRMAFNMLRKKSRVTAARYSLKHAMLELGPSGYPLEVFISELLASEGFEVRSGLILQGKCIEHEVDVLATGKGRVIVGECKFHNSQGLDCDVKVPLYVHSRFRDLADGVLRERAYEGLIPECWIFTNTRYTDDAESYGRCSGMQLVGWNTAPPYAFPDWVDRTGLHPITCLTTLTHGEKRQLLERRFVLARDLVRYPSTLDGLHVSAERKQFILEEARGLCEG